MRRLHVIGLFCFLWCSPAPADLPVPPQVLDPKTVAESWNIIRLATANVQRLLDEGRIEEVPQQISLCSPSLRVLARSGGSAESRSMVDAQTASAFRLINDIAQSGLARLPESTQSGFARFKKVISELQTAFADADIHAVIRFCPQHPEMIGIRADSSCSSCGALLQIRGIPYTDVQATPEKPQLSLTVKKFGAEAVLPGQAVNLEARLCDASGQPVYASSLAPLHGAPLRLLLVDQTLTDFHLLTPSASAGGAGSLTASFVPRLAGPYRLWAEAAPYETAIPEYPHADLGGEFRGADRSRHDFPEALEATAGGLRFQISFHGGNGGPPRARKVGVMRLQVTDASGEPFKQLEPVMNAFAHITGFCEDGLTVMRLHPTGGEILRDDVRGGPAFSFKIYPPQPGFVRFFCQVKVDGKVLTAPFGVFVAK